MMTNLFYRTVDLVERCSLTNRKKNNPLSTEGLINDKQMKVDIIENYMIVKCKLTICNLRMIFKFNSSATTNLE